MAQTPDAPVRPPLRWAGSKRKSLIVLRGFLPAVEHYIEPFAGSASLLFSLSANRSVLGDVNPKLIDFYRVLKSRPAELHTKYKRMKCNAETYYRIRQRYNGKSERLITAARFLYLNRNCFNGIYRVNSAGQFNVPWGGEKVGAPLTLDDLQTASNAIRNTKLVCGDFEEVVLSSLKSDSMVYLDPPYANNEERVFSEYHEDSFGVSDWDRLVRLLKKIDKKGAKFLLSYAGPRSLCSALEVWRTGSLEVTRNVGGFRSTRRKHREFIATNIESSL